MRKLLGLLSASVVLGFTGCAPDQRSFEYYSLLEYGPPFLLEEGKDYELNGVFHEESDNYYIADRERAAKFMIERDARVLEPCLNHASGQDGDVVISIFGRYSGSRTLTSIEEMIVYGDGEWAIRCSIHDYEPLE